jgi:hypothetical protein
MTLNGRVGPVFSGDLVELLSRFGAAKRATVQNIPALTLISATLDFIAECLQVSCHFGRVLE